MQVALALDSLASSHPVSVTVNDPSEINGIFDTISYKKGSAIIQMLEAHIGTEQLRHGLTKYFNDHKFSNAVTADLWRALGDTTGTPKYKLPVCDTFRADCAYKIISIKLNFLYSKIGTDVPSHMGRGTSVPRVLFTIFLILSLTHYLHDPNYLYFDVRAS